MRRWPKVVMNRREPGSVFAYPYLWRVDRNRIDHPKERTTCLTVARQVRRVGGATLVHLFLLAISDRPRPDQEVIELPEIEKRRAGLDPARPAYVVLSEYNYDVLPHSWWYDPNSKDYGRFGRGFTDQIVRRFLIGISRKQASRTDRTG